VRFDGEIESTAFVEWSPANNSTPGEEAPYRPRLSSVRRTLAAASKYNGRHRRHPDAVDVYQLKAGDRVIVPPHILNSDLHGREEASEPMEMSVVDRPEGRGEFGYSSDASFILENPRRGLVSFLATKLDGNAYSRLDFAKHAPFEAREYVQIGKEGDPQLLLKHVDAPTTMTLDKRSLPYIGRFVGMEDGANYVVEIKGAGGVDANVRVPKEQVYALPAGTVKAARQSMHRLPVIQLSFQPGEGVRFRNKWGLIEMGAVIALRDGVMKIMTMAGEISISPKNVFKPSGPKIPVTPHYKAYWTEGQWKSPAGPTGLFAEFLNGGAALTSHPDFAQAAPAEKIEVLMRYVWHNIPWTAAAKQAEDAGLRAFEDLLCAGAGVCKHNSTLLATILSEAGYFTRLVSYVPPGKEGETERRGHAWLEVDMPSDQGEVETYVVDPSGVSGFIKPIREVEKIAQTNPDSNANKWYMQPGREYVFSKTPVAEERVFGERFRIIELPKKILSSGLRRNVTTSDLGKIDLARGYRIFNRRGTEGDIYQHEANPSELIKVFRSHQVTEDHVRELVRLSARVRAKVVSIVPMETVPLADGRWGIRMPRVEGQGLEHFLNDYLGDDSPNGQLAPGYEGEALEILRVIDILTDGLADRRPSWSNGNDFENFILTPDGRIVNVDPILMRALIARMAR
jgi:hypothetical protein